MSEQSTINLLAIDAEPGNVEHIAQPLKSGGFKVNAAHATQEDDIRNAINYKPLDLIILRPSEGLPTLAQIRAWITAADHAIAIIAMTDAASSQRPAELMQAGADNVCDMNDPDYLVAMVGKELNHLQLRKQSRSQQIRLQESERRSRSLLDNSRDAIAYLHEGVHIYANAAYLKLFGYSKEEEMEGVTLMDLVIPPDHDKLKRFLRSSIKLGKANEPLEVTGMDRKKRPFTLHMECQPTTVNDEPCLQILIHDSAEQQGFQKRIRELSKRDTLTGLYNRKFFTEYLNKIQAGELPVGAAVLYILITDYRSITHQLGLEAADQLLGDLAQRLQQLIPPQALVARFFDAVFTIYLPETPRETAVEISQQIREAINTHVSHAAHQLVTTTVCIGICLVQDRRENATQILNNADQACETARQKGGDSIAVYRPPDSRSALARQEDEFLLQLRDAIAEERLELLYQPIASFQGNPTERYKAYLRLLDEERNPLSLEVLGPVAESYGLMQQLDKWILMHSLQALAQHHQKTGKAAVLFVRISDNSVRDMDFCDWLERRLSELNLAGEAVVIEVAEKCTEKSFREAQILRDKLKALGCRFALSHFGGKPHSERILLHLKPDYIKLDIMLIQQLAEVQGDDSARIALAALTEKAQEMKIAVVAADVATAFQMASIWQFGVSLVQGDMVQEAAPQMGFDFAQFAG